MKAYSLGLYEKAMPGTLTWAEKFRSGAAAGYDYLEISIDETDEKLARLEMSAEEREELAALGKREGLPLRSMCLSGHRKYPMGSADPETVKRSMEIMEKAIGLAEDLGIRIIQLAGYDVYYEPSTEETRKRFEENLVRAAEMAARAGVVMGFETMETELMNTVGKAMKYVNLVNSPYLQVYPDIGNITNAAKEYGTDVLEDLKCGAGHLVAMHLKETKPGIFREVPYGQGHVDFPAAVRTAWETGVRRYVTEFWYKGSPEWKKDVEDARIRMGRLLDETAEEFRK